jgi:membrane protein YqaA with SNARE-associated domain
VLQRLYQWVLSKAAHPHALWWLMAFAFAEASFFPIPADILMIPMVIAVRRRAWAIAAWCTLASVLGGCFGWLVGYGLFETVGRPLIELYSSMDQFARVQAEYNRYGVFFVLIGALTPIPYKVVTIASGVAQMDFISFTLASIVGRGARYFILAGALYVFGPWIKDFMDRNLKLAMTVFAVLLVGGFVLLAYVI